MNSSFVIGVAGGSGSGKTTLARALGERLDATLLAEDDYYLCSSRVPDFDPLAYNFDHPDAKDFPLLCEHLEGIKRGEEVARPAYDFVTHRRRSATTPLRCEGVLIVEGILVLHDPRVRASLDLALYVHAPDDVRLARRLIRDTKERGRTPESVALQWLGTVRPMHHAFVEPQKTVADLIVDTGEGRTVPDVDSLVARIGAARGRDFV